MSVDRTTNASLSSRLPTQGIIDVDELNILLYEMDELEVWFPILRFLNPRELSITTGDLEDSKRVPTINPHSFVNFPSLPWTQLKLVTYVGPGSVLLPPGGGNELAFGECLRLGGKEGERVAARLRIERADETDIGHLFRDDVGVCLQDARHLSGTELRVSVEVMTVEEGWEKEYVPYVVGEAKF